MSRPETGPMEFEGDWPGLFIRGDNAFAYSLALRRLLEVIDRPKAVALGINRLLLENLHEELISCDTKNVEHYPLQKMKRIEDATRDLPAPAQGECVWCKKPAADPIHSLPDTDIRHHDYLRSPIPPPTEPVGELVEALEPFARRADYFDGKLKANGGAWDDRDEYVDDPPSTVYLGHLRAARTALARARGK